MSDELPEDIWIVAQDVAHDVYEADCQLMETGESPVDTARVIAFAILAERERAEDIAKGVARECREFADKAPRKQQRMASSAQAFVADRIAKAIRTTTPEAS